MAKVIYIAATRISISRPTITTIWKGTVEELATEVFGYTLECGNSWNSKVNCHPKTANSLVTNLNKACEASCSHYQDTYYNLASKSQIQEFEENATNDSRSYRIR